MNAYGENGFALKLEVRVVSVFSGATQDAVAVQSFQSESANDWHFVIDFIEPGGPNGWLQGDESLPTAYPTTFADAFLSIYFTDEFDWVRNIDATVLSVTPSTSVPLPPLMVPFAVEHLAWLAFCASRLAKFPHLAATRYSHRHRSSTVALGSIMSMVISR